MTTSTVQQQAKAIQAYLNTKDETFVQLAGHFLFENQEVEFVSLCTEYGIPNANEIWESLKNNYDRQMTGSMDLYGVIGLINNYGTLEAEYINSHLESEIVDANDVIVKFNNGTLIDDFASKYAKFDYITLSVIDLIMEDDGDAERGPHVTESYEERFTLLLRFNGENIEITEEERLALTKEIARINS